MKDRFLRVATAVAVAVTTTFVVIPPAAAAKRPDLKVTSVSNPPASLRRGRTFNITDVTKNIGKAKAKASITRYYLSKDNKRGGQPDVRLGKSRKVKILGKGKSHKGTVKGVLVPKSMAPAAYFVIACADDKKRVRESNEKNNCKASKTKMSVTAAPPAPNMMGTDPPSPNNDDTTPLVMGSAEAGSTVKVYAGSCTDANLVVTGPAATFASPGLQVPDTKAVTSSNPVDYVATATDTVGNVSPCSTGDLEGRYVYDVDPPGDVSFTAQPIGISNDYTADWAWTGEVGATYACSLEKGGVPVQSGSCDLGTFTSPDLRSSQGGPGDGTYEFYVLQTDAAGNAALASTSDTFLLDVTPPGNASILSEPSTPSNVPTPTWTFNGGLSPDAHYECQLRRDGVVVEAFTPCGDPVAEKTYDLSAAGTYPDGTYVFEVQQEDEAGNVSPVLAVSNDFVLDRVANAPTFEQQPTDPSNNANPVWEFLGEINSAFACSLSGPNGSVTTGVDCTTGTTYAFDLSDDVTYPDGDYTLSVVQTDQATNVSPAGLSTFELDRTNPNPPSIESAPDDPSNDTTPTWTFATDETDPVTYQCELMFGPTTVESGACDGGTFARVDPLTDQGMYTFNVRQTDDAGNQSAPASSTYVLDTDPPGPVVFSVTPDDPTNDTMPTWTWTGEPGATFDCLLEGAVEVESVPCNSGSYTSPDLDALADTMYTLTVFQTDEAGNPALIDAVDTFVLDTDPPDAPTFSSLPTPRNDVTPTWTWTGETNATYTCTLHKGGTPIETDVACDPAIYTAPDLTSSLDGTYTLEVVQIDEAGNPAPAPATDDFVLDTEAPALPTGLTVTPAGPSPDPNVTIAGSAEADSTVTIYSAADCDPLSELGQGTATAGSFSIPLVAPDNTTTSFYATATDAATNVSGCSLDSDSFTHDDEAPVPPDVDSTSPASPAADDQPEVVGVAEAGSTVRIYATADCSGTEVASGPAADYGSAGLTVDVPINSAATFRATATDAAGNTSDCSSESVLFEHLIPETEPDNNTRPGTTDVVSDFDLDGQVDPITTWSGSSILFDTDFFEFVVPAEAAGSGIKAETFDLADGATCGIDTDLVLYQEDGTPIADDDDTDDGIGNCSLIDGIESLADAGAQSLAAGTYHLGVTTDSALSIDYRLVIEISGDVFETEPNDTSGTADGNITGDTLIQGAISPMTDRDFFKLDLVEPRVVRFDSYDPDGNCPSPMQTTLSWFHPNALNATEPNRFRSEPGTSGNAGGIGQCAAITMLVPAGISYIQIEESARNATIAGYIIEVDVLDVEVLESEANDGFGSADPFTLDGETVMVGSFDDGDEDWYSFTLTSTTSVRLETFEGGTDVPAGGSDLNCESNDIEARLTLFDTDGSTSLGSDSGDGRGACSTIDGFGGTDARDGYARDLPAGTYFVKVNSASTSNPQPSFDYRVAITAR